MKLNKRKFDLALARRRLTIYDLRDCGISLQTLAKMQKGCEVRPATIGKVAHALNVDPVELVDQEVK